MMRNIFLLLLGVPVCLCVFHAWLNRRAGIHPHRTPFTAGFYTNLVFVPVYVCLHILEFGFDAWQFLCGLLLMLIYTNCLVFLNWFIFTLTDVSMHIQLLMQIHRNHALTPQLLVERYNKTAILTNRIPRLIELGQLRMENGRLFANGKSVWFGASVCLLLRKILGIPLRPEEAKHDARF